MRWTDTRPETDGWWWWRNGPRSHACVVCITRGRVYWHNLTGSDDLTEMYGQWAGPLPLPAQSAK